jgi:hypothetical protein
MAPPIPDSTNEGNGFGASLAVNRNLAIVGDAVIGVGSATVFTRSSSTSEWNQVQQLLDPASDPMDGFGLDVATDGDTLFIAAGATSGSLNAYLGAVYVYSQNASSQWQETQRLQAGDAQSAWFFGSTVALGTNFVLIGAPGYRTASGPRGQGAVYVFTKNSNGWWQQTQEITDPVGGEYDAFGTSIVLDGSTALVSANEGLAYVLTRDSTGVWNITATLNPPVASPYLIEANVALQGDQAFIGLSGNQSAYNQTISVYRYYATSDQWQYVQSLSVTDPDLAYFGRSGIAVDGSTLLVGASETGAGTASAVPGAVYVFSQDPADGLWQENQRINGPNSDSHFGSVITSADGTWLASGNILGSTSQTSGVVYILGPSIDLSLACQADVSSIEPGQVVHITYTITNHDPALTATNVEVMLTVADATITYETVNGAHCTAGTTSTTLVCNVGDLAPGAMASVTVPVSISYGPGGFTTTAQVSADQGDASPGDNSASTTTLVQKPPATGGGGFENGIGLVFLAWLLVMNRYAINNRSEINIKR